MIETEYMPTKRTWKMDLVSCAVSLLSPKMIAVPTGRVQCPCHTYRHFRPSDAGGQKKMFRTENTKEDPHINPVSDSPPKTYSNISPHASQAKGGAGGGEMLGWGGKGSTPTSSGYIFGIHASMDYSSVDCHHVWTKMSSWRQVELRHTEPRFLEFQIVNILHCGKHPFQRIGRCGCDMYVDRHFIIWVHWLFAS